MYVILLGIESNIIFLDAFEYKVLITCMCYISHDLLHPPAYTVTDMLEVH